MHVPIELTQGGPDSSEVLQSFVGDVATIRYNFSRRSNGLEETTGSAFA